MADRIREHLVVLRILHEQVLVIGPNKGVHRVVGAEAGGWYFKIGHRHAWRLDRPKGVAIGDEGQVRTGLRVRLAREREAIASVRHRSGRVTEKKVETPVVFQWITEVCT